MIRHLIFYGFVQNSGTILVVQMLYVKFIWYSEKAKKFCEISTLLLSVCTLDKSKVEISQHFVASSEYTNFIIIWFVKCFEIFHNNPDLISDWACYPWDSSVSTNSIQDWTHPKSPELFIRPKQVNLSPHFF